MKNILREKMKIVRKNSLIILCITIGVFNNILPQYTLRKMEESIKYAKYEIIFDSLKDYHTQQGLIIQDESKPGSPVLKNTTLFIKIIPKSTVRVSMTDVILANHDEYPIRINPLALINDSSIIYRDSELKEEYFQDEIFPLNIIDISDYFWIGDDYYCAVTINEFRYNWREKKLLQILKSKIILEYQNSTPIIKAETSVLKAVSNNLPSSELLKNSFQNSKTSFFSNLANKTDSWIDFLNEYYKLAITQDGMYRIDYSDLENYGINPSKINPQTIKIFLKGKQIPLFVQSQEANTFQKGDYFEFWCEKNYESGDYRKQVQITQDYINYLDRYTDTTYVWLTFDGEKGQRLYNQSSLTSSGSDTISTYVNRLHFEDDRKLLYYDADQPRTQLPYWQENKIWSWFESWELGTKKGFDFFINGLIKNSKVKTIVRAISSAASISQPEKVHNVGVSFNNSTNIGSQLFNKNQTVTFTQEFSSDLVFNGKNQIFIHNIPTGISPNTFLLDWFDIEYRRTLSTNYNNPIYQNDSLNFSIKDSIPKLQRFVKVTGISSDKILLYKTKPIIKRIYNFQLFGTDLKTLVFNDTLGLNDSYFITKETLVKKPKFLYKKLFLDLKQNNIGADYIIVSNNQLKNTVNSYSEFIKDNYKVRIQVSFVNDIYDQFGYGYKNPRAIKDFLFEAYSSWSKPKPKYLFLIGEANYDYKNKWLVTPAEKYQDLVSSFGFPVSDTWYVCFDSTGVNIPQMFVGRLPVSNNSQVLDYLAKHKGYLLRPFDFLNKRVLLFSGGSADKQSELDQLRRANEEVDKIFASSDLKPRLNHFYKTTNPFSNFGPYSYDIVRDAIDSGAVYISYLGHSGTQTWDNGINSVQQLNNTNNGNPLIADFGCSTAKFAEPDIKSFSEQFVSDINSEAIGYIGNSSVGFLSVATTFPQIFASYIADTSTYTLGELHLLSKLKLYQEHSGFSDVNKSFNFCSTLIGDPIIKLKIPTLPSIALSQKSLKVVESILDDKMDFFEFRCTIVNEGRVIPDSIILRITDTYDGKINFSTELKLKCPSNYETITSKIPILNLSGLHNVTLALDPLNMIKELDKEDNILTFSRNVNSASIRAINSDYFYSANLTKVSVLNPTNRTLNNEITFVIDTLSTFLKPIQIKVPLENVYTSINLPEIVKNKRYWWKAKLGNSENYWSSTNSFINTSNDFNWILTNPLKSVTTKNVEFNSDENKWMLSKTKNTLRVQSGGLYDGATAIIEYNGQDKVGELLWGMATAILDSNTLEPKKILLFKSGGINLTDSLASYINHLPLGTIIALAIGTEARNYILGSNANSSSRQAIKTLGSKYIEQVGYRESWAIIGKKGAKTGSVHESYKKILEGSAAIDTTLFSSSTNGSIEFPIVQNVNRWNSIQIKQSGNIKSFLNCEDQSSLKYSIGPIISDGKFSLAELNNKNIKKMNVVSNFYGNNKDSIPSIEFVGIKYKSASELATNYQVVSLSKDSLEQGEKASLNFSVYNVGESTASNFKIRVDLAKKDNSKEKLFEQVVDSIQTEKKKDFSLSYTTDKLTGSNQFQINIDTENAITELYKDNNFYSVPFYVKPNDKPASLKLTIDGADIINGDFISSKPNFKIELNDESLIPITDTTKILLYLNNKRIYFSTNTSVLSYNYSSSNPKMVVNYTPTLADGDYTLKVIGKNATDQIIDSTGIVRKFTVKNELQLLNAYNYPNPFKDDTYFTFKLTQIPDELKIIIYTIAGRKIKEIKLNSTELKYDFNRIFWDGRDQDGDLTANGVYLYKIISQKGSEKTELTQKLAILR